MRKALVIVAALGFALGGLQAQNQPTVVLSPVAAHSLDSLWLDSYTRRTENAACFRPGTFQTVRTPERTWAVILGPLSPGNFAYADSTAIAPPVESAGLCDSTDIMVHTHILPDGEILNLRGVLFRVMRWIPSGADSALARSRPALFSLLVTAPESVLVYGAKQGAVWR